MRDSRQRELAELLINHSTRIQPGEHVLIEMFDAPYEMAIELVEATRRAGGHPHIELRSQPVMRALQWDADEDNLKVWADCDLYRMKKMAAYIGLRGASNVSEECDIPDESRKAMAEIYRTPVHLEQRVKKTKWCVLRWPTSSMAQLANMSTEAFEKFYFDVCCLDYGLMMESGRVLAERMTAADQVHIKGPGDTDITFSIKDIPAIECCGEHNIPDGECFTAPVRDSINGIMHYNTPTVYYGQTFENVRFEFAQGKIVNASCDGDADALNSILDSDEGARYIGEFAIGFNPHILEPMKDILFDEKIAGSLHFTPGAAYEEADNGNRSQVHWDLVLIQRPEYGGGEIYFDGELIRRDGLFVTEELAALNPEELLAATAS